MLPFRIAATITVFARFAAGGLGLKEAGANIRLSFEYER